MNQKKLKKLRKKLREERVESGPVFDEKNVQLPPRLLMRRKDPLSVSKSSASNMLPGTKTYQGGAINHPLSDRALYQFAKRKGLSE